MAGRDLSVCIHQYLCFALTRFQQCYGTEILFCDLQLWGRCLGDRSLLLIYSCSPCPSPWSLLQYLQTEQKEAEERLPTAVQNAEDLEQRGADPKEQQEG